MKITATITADDMMPHRLYVPLVAVWLLLATADTVGWFPSSSAFVSLMLWLLFLSSDSYWTAGWRKEREEREWNEIFLSD